MIWVQGDLQCPKCRNVIHAKPAVQAAKEKRSQSDFIYISENPRDSTVRIKRECPECGNREAFHWVSGISGEHAGIGRERTVDHFRCTKCAYTWAES
jgi:DNA-directed RNA polymerase subunit M/transcription elongation factor TFIIS